MLLETWYGIKNQNIFFFVVVRDILIFSVFKEEITFRRDLSCVKVYKICFLSEKRSALRARELKPTFSRQNRTHAQTLFSSVHTDSFRAMVDPAVLLSLM